MSRSNRGGYAMRRSNAAANRAVIDIYERIGQGWFEGLTAKQFRLDLAELGDVNEIEVHINSEGGSIFDGLAIYNTLVAHEAKVFVHVDGMALSIASVIAMAGDEIHIAENAWLMIHDPWSWVSGSSEDLRREADLLDSLKGSLVSSYKRHVDLSNEELGQMMAAETWLSAEDAVAKGFAHVVDHETSAAAACADDPSIFQQVPQGAMRFFRNASAPTPASPNADAVDIGAKVPAPIASAPTAPVISCAACGGDHEALELVGDSETGYWATCPTGNRPVFLAVSTSLAPTGPGGVAAASDTDDQDVSVAALDSVFATLEASIQAGLDSSITALTGHLPE